MLDIKFGFPEIIHLMEVIKKLCQSNNMKMLL